MKLLRVTNLLAPILCSTLGLLTPLSSFAQDSSEPSLDASPDYSSPSDADMLPEAPSEEAVTKASDSELAPPADGGEAPKPAPAPGMTKKKFA